MRALKTPIAGLPAGTLYQVENVEDLGRCVVWRGPLDKMDRIEKAAAAGTRAPLIYDARVAALGCNPEEPVPCGICGEEIPAVLTLCPECGRDPDADVECGECQDHTGRPSGEVEYCDGDGQRGHRETCRACRGDKTVEAPYAYQRELALTRARRWKLSQSAEANPVPAAPSARYSTALEADLAAEAHYGGTLGEGMELELRKASEGEWGSRGPR
jgi:hypothetical protein